MGQYDKLCKIDIPKARALIVKSIAEYRRHALMATMIELFLMEIDVKKRIDAKLATKLQIRLQEEAPALKVYRVTFTKTSAVLSSRPEYTFKVWMYDIEQSERTFVVRTKEDGTLDIDQAMVADRKWAAHADFLEQKLARFAYHATKFNDMVHALQNACEEAVMPGDSFPVYPLSSFYHWYQLHA